MVSNTSRINFRNSRMFQLVFDNDTGRQNIMIDSIMPDKCIDRVYYWNGWTALLTEDAMFATAQTKKMIRGNADTHAHTRAAYRAAHAHTRRTKIATPIAQTHQHTPTPRTWTVIKTYIRIYSALWIRHQLKWNRTCLCSRVYRLLFAPSLPLPGIEGAGSEIRKEKADFENRPRGRLHIAIKTRPKRTRAEERVRTGRTSSAELIPVPASSNYRSVLPCTSKNVDQRIANGKRIADSPKLMTYMAWERSSLWACSTAW